MSFQIVSMIMKKMKEVDNENEVVDDTNGKRKSTEQSQDQNLRRSKRKR